MNRLMRSICLVRGEDVGAFVTNYSLSKNFRGRVLNWELNPKILGILRDTSLRKRRIRQWVRLELGVPVAARSRYTAMLYTRLAAAAVAGRSRANMQGWVTVTFTLEQLARELRWKGWESRPDDLMSQVIRPALRELCKPADEKSHTSTSAMPKTLLILWEETRSARDKVEAITFQLQRLSIKGKPLDMPKDTELIVAPLRPPSPRRESRSTAPAVISGTPNPTEIGLEDLIQRPFKLLTRSK
jgi:hypothetical protein